MKPSSDLSALLFFAAVPFLFIYPLLSSGYIFTLDASFTPHMPWPSFSSSSFWYESLIAFFSGIIPSYWVEKAIMYAIFLLSGWGMYRLMPTNSIWIKLFAGLFYSINPFTYQRFMGGQLALLLGYGLFPFTAKMLMSFFRKPNWKNTMKLALLATVNSTISIHYSIIIALFFTIYALFEFYMNTAVRRLQIVKKILSFIVIFLLLNVNWIGATLRNRNDIYQQINSFLKDDLIAFQSVPDQNFGLIFNLLAGYGFWAEANDYFILSKDVIFFWPILAITVLIIFFVGVSEILKNADAYGFSFIGSLLVLFVISLYLAGGISIQPLKDTVLLLYEYVPFMRGFREPQKLIGIVMFCYAYFGSVGMYRIISHASGIKKSILLSFFVFFPLLYSPTFLNGFWGQLKPVSYPESWNTLEGILLSDTDHFLTLFFPWHQYMRFDFSNNLVVANPAPNFFTKPILSSRNYETSSLYTKDSRVEARLVEELLSAQKNPVDQKILWGSALAPMKIKYIILSKEDDWKSYGFLGTSNDLKKVFESNELILYQNLQWVGPLSTCCLIHE